MRALSRRCCSHRLPPSQAGSRTGRTIQGLLRGHQRRLRRSEPAWLFAGPHWWQRWRRPGERGKSLAHRRTHGSGHGQCHNGGLLRPQERRQGHWERQRQEVAVHFVEPAPSSTSCGGRRAGGGTRSLRTTVSNRKQNPARGPRMVHRRVGFQNRATDASGKWSGQGCFKGGIRRNRNGPDERHGLQSEQNRTPGKFMNAGELRCW